MRELTDHRVNETNEALKILVLDQPGAGGANHVYAILSEQDQTMNGKDVAAGNISPDQICANRGMIRFQNGPIKEAGVNGVTQEALMAIVIDRLRSFQAGPYSCRENAIALTHFETGLLFLLKRTRDRQARGVEGTSTK